MRLLWGRVGLGPTTAGGQVERNHRGSALPTTALQRTDNSQGWPPVRCVTYEASTQESLRTGLSDYERLNLADDVRRLCGGSAELYEDIQDWHTREQWVSP